MCFVILRSKGIGSTEAEKNIFQLFPNKPLIFQGVLKIIFELPNKRAQKRLLAEPYLFNFETFY